MIESENNKEKKDEVESPQHHLNNSSLGNNIINMSKQCRCCFETIHISAKVCKHCGRHQNFWLRHFGDTAIIVSIVMVIIAVAQLIGAFKEQINASNALKIAENAAKDSQKALAQITSDANEISCLKNRIETQSATIDLVAKSAEEARKIVDDLKEKSQVTDKKLSILDDTTVKAQKSLTEIERSNMFSMVLLAAQNDNWKAFDQLRKWGEDNSFPLQEMALNACVKIMSSYSEPFRLGYIDYRWPEGVDPWKISLQEFMNFYQSLPPIFHAHLVKKVWNRSDITKKDRMAFLIEVLKNSNSLTARDYAGNFFVEATGDKNLKWKPFQIEPLLKWWEEHGENIN